MPSSYFRQLQEISDTVAEVEWEGSAAHALQEHETDKVEVEAKINTARARHRYLEHLARSQEAGTLDDEEGACILCRCEFSVGYITQWCVAYVSLPRHPDCFALSAPMFFVRCAFLNSSCRVVNQLIFCRYVLGPGYKGKKGKHVPSAE